MLRARGSLAQGASATWAIESPVPGVVFINVEIEGPKSLSPLHWRAGDWIKPPLDIEVNPVNGAVQALQLVLQDEHVSRGILEATPEYMPWGCQSWKSRIGRTTAIEMSDAMSRSLGGDQ